MKGKKLCVVSAMLAGAMALTGVLGGCFAPPPGENVFVEEDLAARIDANIPENTAAEIRVGVRATDAEETILRGLIEAFNGKYPNIKVTPVRVSGDAYDTALVSYIPAGTMPDLFWVNPNNLSYYYNNGVAFTLDNYIKQSNLNTQDYVGAAMEECQSPAEHYFMMPRDYVQLVMYYNKDLMRQLVAAENEITAAPSVDWTWDDFLSYCAAFKQSGLIAGDQPVLDVELDWEAVYYPFIRSFGGEIINEQGEVTIDAGIDSETEREQNGAYRYLGELLRLRNGGYIRSQETSTGASVSFYGGFSPFYIHSRSSLTDAYKAFQALGKPDDVGVLPMPAVGETPSTSAGCTGYAIYRGSEKKDAAWAFLRFMMTQDGQEALEKTGNVVPVMISEREKENPVWKSYPAGMNVDHDMFLAHSERGIQMDFLRRLPTATHADAFSYLRTMYTSVLYNNASRVDSIRLASDRMYNLLAYNETKG